MKKLVVLLLFVCAGLPLFAQDDDCDPNSSMEDLFASKRTEFGPNCMQWAINIAMNVNHNRSFALADGSYVPVFFAQRKESPLPGGEWSTTFRETNNWIGQSSKGYEVFSRPGSIMNLGPMISMEFYTLSLDTGIIKVDINKILKKVRDEYDDFEDELNVTVTPHYEEGQLYCKVTGNIMLLEGLKPTKAGDIISYFYMWVANNVNYTIKYDENEAAKKIGDMKFDFWNKTQLGAALKVGDMVSKGNEVKDGRFVWSQSDGDKVIQVDNFGTECFVYIQVKNSTKEINTKVVENLNAWVSKKKPKLAESAEIKLYGDTPWVLLKFKIAGKTGSDLYEDIREDVINDWGDDFIEEAEDVVDDLK